MLEIPGVFSFIIYIQLTFVVVNYYKKIPSEQYLIIYTYTRYILKVLRLMMYLPRQQWTEIKTVIFFKIVPLAFNLLIQVNFSLVKAFLKFFFWYDRKLYNHIYINIILKSDLCEEFSVKKIRIAQSNGECYTCTNKCFIPKYLSKK